mmetsp:Transcript_71910/g.194524  ORF Transcript_71910/g.194524 Transcript_71910/m.194524 type:complete len:327 (+) Transcript_71910:107-1087(+)
MAKKEKKSVHFAPHPTYGAVPEAQEEETAVQPPEKARAAPSFRDNLLLVGLTLAIPWLFFAIVFLVMSFSIRYHYPEICFLVVFLCFSALASLQSISSLSAMKGKDATWLLVMCGLSFTALVLGCHFGNINFRRNTVPVQDALRLNTYQGVDPLTDQGSAVMDAGHISFTKDAALDLKRAMAFRNGRMYCVTPIVNTKVPGGLDQRYDFWAVGTDCCSGNAADFHCGEYDNPYAHAGLRVTSEDLVSYFKLAVRQAEATYGVQAPHPVFLTWLQDPLDAASASQDAAWRYYMAGLYGYFLGQVVAVGAAALVLTDLGPWLVGGEPC